MPNKKFEINRKRAFQNLISEQLKLELNRDIQKK